MTAAMLGSECGERSTILEDGGTLSFTRAEMLT